MGLVLNLPAELESELTAEAARLRLSLPEYVMRLLAEARIVNPPPPRSGAELLPYWEREGVIDMRSAIADSQAHARALREQGQRRGREKTMDEG